VIPALPALKMEPLTRFEYIRRDGDYTIAPDMIGVKGSDFEKANRDFRSYASTPFDPVELKKKFDLQMRTWGATYYGFTASTVSLPISVLGFNRAALVALPGEIFNEFSVLIKQQFPDKDIIVGELVDADDCGYVPTRAAFAEGGYESACATLVPGSGEKIAETAQAMLREFYTQ
jgi:hypothetical protein